jgi:hypothetical protein
MNRQRSRVVGLIGSVAVVLLLGCAFASPGIAAEPHGGTFGAGHWGGPGAAPWRDHFEHRRFGEIRPFPHERFDRWHAGHWFHGEHLGRQGWWWIVDGEWFFYPSPVYPYPDPYVPPAVVGQAPSPSTDWYYCASKNAYYPYVTDCPEGWQQVVPQPTP